MSCWIISHVYTHSFYAVFTDHRAAIIRFFQYTFACALSSIVAGTIAERTKMMAYLCYSIFLCGFVYPVCAHAFWSYNGFLSPFAAEPLWGSGVIDLAGSCPVHMCGGVAALVMAIVLGPRRGRFYDEDGVMLDEPKAMGPHSVALQVRTLLRVQRLFRDFRSVSHLVVVNVMNSHFTFSSWVPLHSGLDGMVSTPVQLS